MGGQDLLGGTGRCGLPCGSRVLTPAPAGAGRRPVAAAAPRRVAHALRAGMAGAGRQNRRLSLLQKGFPVAFEGGGLTLL